MRALSVREGGMLSVDDTVLDKPCSQEGKTEPVGYFWSGLHGKVVRGIDLVTLFYGEMGGLRVPVNFRVVDKAEASKQVCHAEQFFVRCKQAIRNHLLRSLRAFVELQRWREEISSRSSLRRHLADAVVTHLIQQRTRAHGA